MHKKGETPRSRPPYFFKKPNNKIIFIYENITFKFCGIRHRACLHLRAPPKWPPLVTVLWVVVVVVVTELLRLGPPLPNERLPPLWPEWLFEAIVVVVTVL